MPMTYVWQKVGDYTHDLTANKILSWKNIQRKDSGKYTCKTTSRLGARTSTEIELNIECK